jgi:hypothetical protein
MWYSYRNSTVLHPLTLQKVSEISELNQKGSKAPDLIQISAQPELAGKSEEKEKEIELVGQTSLRSIERTIRKKRFREKRNQKPGGKNRSPRQGKKN